MTLWTDLRRALSAEVYKLKHSAIPVTVVVLPLAITVVLGGGIPLLQGGAVYFRAPGVNPWLMSVAGMLQMWAFLQVFIAAVFTAQLAGMEHGNQMWKRLFALPVSREAIYLAKVIVALGLFGLSLAALLFGILITGLALNLLKPEFGFGAAIPWGEMVGLLLITFAASWLMIAIHVWAGIYWPSFAPAMGVAMVAFLLNMVFSGSEAFMRIFPWSLPTNFLATGFNLSGNVVNGEIALTSVAFSVVASIAVAVISARQITRRDVL